MVSRESDILSHIPVESIFSLDPSGCIILKFSPWLSYGSTQPESLEVLAAMALHEKHYYVRSSAAEQLLSCLAHAEDQLSRLRTFALNNRWAGYAAPVSSSVNHDHQDGYRHLWPRDAGFVALETALFLDSRLRRVWSELEARYGFLVTVMAPKEENDDDNDQSEAMKPPVPALDNSPLIDRRNIGRIPLFCKQASTLSSIARSLATATKNDGTAAGDTNEIATQINAVITGLEDQVGTARDEAQRLRAYAHDLRQENLLLVWERDLALARARHEVWMTEQKSLEVAEEKLHAAEGNIKRLEEENRALAEENRDLEEEKAGMKERIHGMEKVVEDLAKTSLPEKKDGTSSSSSSSEGEEEWFTAPETQEEPSGDDNDDAAASANEAGDEADDEDDGD